MAPKQRNETNVDNIKFSRDVYAGKKSVKGRLSAKAV